MQVVDEGATLGGVRVGRKGEGRTEMDILSGLWM